VLTYYKVIKLPKGGIYMGLFNKGKNYTYSLAIDGMRCSMCEAHINDVVRKNFNIKKVKSSHLKNNTTIISLEQLDINKLKEVIKSTGYEVLKVEVKINE
jgi:copper chaperone CopZ